MKITFLKAFHGDSILISFKDQEKKKRNILIDGGPAWTYEETDKRTKRKKPGDLKNKISSLEKKKEKIDLLILTHVDSDHIDGILKWFEDSMFSEDMIGKVWFNSGRLISEYIKNHKSKKNDLKIRRGKSSNTGIEQGVSFENFILKKKLWYRKLIKSGDNIQEFGLNFKILSPDISKLKELLKKWKKEQPESLTTVETDYMLSLKEHIAKDKFKEDNKTHNGSSIAFIMTYKTKNYLFLGDAHPSTLVRGLEYFKYSKTNPLKAEFVKVSHHGSKGNTSSELLNFIDSNKFIISSNGKYFGLPDKQCLARIIKLKPKAKFYFNYPELIEKIFSNQDYIDFKFKALEWSKEIYKNE